MIGLRTNVPAPQPNAETKPFWDAAAEGRFVLRFCNGCGRPHWYPRAICPFCFNDDGAWREAGGTGVIYSFSPMRRASEPYVIAYVTLDEGPTMMTNIVFCEIDALRIGQAVTVVFQPTIAGPPIPVFKPL